MNTLGRIALLGSAIFALSACARVPLATAPPAEREAIAANLTRDISVLASDEFGGRRPGTEGERLTINYIVEQMQAAGLTSGTNDPGSAWRAPVNLISAEAGESRISFGLAAGELAINAEQGAAFTTGRRLLIDDVEMVFVGREAEQVLAEEIAGKVVVMLGEPGVSPARRATLFEADPAAIITVVEDAEAIAGTNRAFGRERMILASEDERRLSVFVSQSAMDSALGADQWASLREAAEAEEFVPSDLAITAMIEATARRREFTSSNVLGLLPGTLPGSGAVVLLGHWDHLGVCGADTAEDAICNGAVDNASGIAAMLELARRLKASGPHDRDIYFLATSAEEFGLLGARAFVKAPPVPLESIVAAFNFDSVAIAPAGSPVGFIGEGETHLDAIIMDVIAAGDRELGDRDLAAQYLRRQDGWALLEMGVPAVVLSTSFGSQITLGPYLSTDYHRPSDEIGNIELGGAIDDLLLNQELIERTANTAIYTPPGQ